MQYLKFEQKSAVPKYQQIVNGLLDSISKDELMVGHQLPSINRMANEYSLARETVVKAFRLLEEKGVVHAVHGKGFYVASKNVDQEYKVFALFSNFSAYKSPMFEAVKNTIGQSGTVDYAFHHFSHKLFSSLIKEARGQYTHYIISLFDHPDITESVNLLPLEKTFLIDRKPKEYKNPFVGVYQDFYNNIIDFLDDHIDKVKRYDKLVFYFRDKTTQPPRELVEGFNLFCKRNNVHGLVEEKIDNLLLQKGVGYIVIDDDDLVNLVLSSREKGLDLGKDAGIISYNESSLKKVVADGISTISTDFEAMGRQIGKMILANDRISYTNSCRFIDRGSF